MSERHPGAADLHVLIGRLATLAEQTVHDLNDFRACYAVICADLQLPPVPPGLLFVETLLDTFATGLREKLK